MRADEQMRVPDRQLAGRRAGGEVAQVVQRGGVFDAFAEELGFAGFRQAAGKEHARAAGPTLEPTFFFTRQR